uniref:Uncharacterized protein n=1 Tax=Anguilla anguilla TaxID=7936 RepID=A0A0E9REH8_ANGAN
MAKIQQSVVLVQLLVSHIRHNKPEFRKSYKSYCIAQKSMSKETTIVR